MNIKFQMSKRAKRLWAQRLRICHLDFFCHWSLVIRISTGPSPEVADGLASPDCADAQGRLFCRRFKNATVAHSSAHNPTAIRASLKFGENIKKKPLPLTRAEKLETQN